MTGWWVTSIGALGTLWSAAPSLKAGPPLAISAEFVLQTTDTSGVDTVAGAVRFVPGGDVCVVVTSPRPQEMRLSPRELVVYYPDQNLAFVQHVAPEQSPPMLDAIVAGVVDPSGTLPGGSKLIERRRAGPNLFTRWKVADGSGQELGEMRALESREGALSVELLDRAGAPQRRFSFQDRVRVGARSVPRAIVAEYFGAGGKPMRKEKWDLRNVVPFQGARSAVPDCARLRPGTKVQELN